MATISNFNVEQGSTFTTTINISNTLGGLFQLNSYTARAKMRKSYASSTFTSFTCTIVENSPAQDTITMNLSAAQTKALKPGRYVYDLEIYNSTSGEVLRILEGQIEVLAGVTQANPLAQGLEFKYTAENYVAHVMYGPNGSPVTANSPADHTYYNGLGYKHVYPIGGGFNRPAYYQGALDTIPVNAAAIALDTTNNSPGDSAGEIYNTPAGNQDSTDNPNDNYGSGL